jgi:hypothetical protein
MTSPEHPVVTEWKASLVRWAAGLDLAEVEGRVSFRTRLLWESRHTKVEWLRLLAMELGDPVPGRSRHDVVRSIARSFIAAADDIEIRRVE